MVSPEGDLCVIYVKPKPSRSFDVVFQQIVTEFDKNNRAFYTAAHRDEKETLQLTSELSRGV